MAPAINPGISATTIRRSPGQTRDTKLRLERSERIIRNLRTGRADGAKQGALAGVGHADKPDIGDEPKFEAQVAVFTFGARLGEAWGLCFRGPEMPVAQAALATAGDDDLFLRHAQIGDENLAVEIVHQRSRRDADDHFIAGPSVLLFAHPRLATLGAPMMFAGKIEKGTLVYIGNENDGRAVAPIAAVGSAFGNELLAAKRDATRSAVAGFHMNNGFINEHSG